jgi:hypothetical protein
MPTRRAAAPPDLVERKPEAARLAIFNPKSHAMRQYPSYLLPAALLVVLGLGSCSNPGESHNYSVENVEIILAGPLFEGPNSGQMALEIDLATAIGDSYSPDTKITGAHLLKAEVVAGDSSGFDALRSLVLSFASDNADVPMQEAASLNPVPEGVDRAGLVVAPEAELGSLVAEGKLYVILDADLAADFLDGDRRFLLNLELSISAK